MIGLQLPFLLGDDEHTRDQAQKHPEDSPNGLFRQERCNFLVDYLDLNRLSENCELRQ